MSRPKIGSVTALAVSGENGTWLRQSRIVSQDEATDPATVRAIRTLTTISDHPRDAASGPGCRRRRRLIGPRLLGAVAATADHGR